MAGGQQGAEKYGSNTARIDLTQLELVNGAGEARSPVGLLGGAGEVGGQLQQRRSPA